MHNFEKKRGARLRGLDPAGIAEVVQVARFGPYALNLVFRVNGRVGERLVYRGEENGFEFLDAGRSYAFDADGGLLRLASEAYRIRLAYLFDPYLAVSASQIEALPHQITAARRNNEATLEVSTDHQLLNEQSGHHCLTGAGIVSEEKPKMLTRKHLAVDSAWSSSGRTKCPRNLGWPSTS